MPGPRAPEAERREQIVNAAYVVSLRTGINGVTLRAVAAEAKLSHGLVIFYYRRKDVLIDALLDRLLATTVMVRASLEASQASERRSRFTALLRDELGRLSRNSRSTRLLLEYWALGVRQPAVRRKIAAALERYRAAFRTMAEEILPPKQFGTSEPTPAALATVAVGLITGFIVQAMMDPKNIDTPAYIAAVEDLIGRLVPNHALEV
jgi:TetR/AcrR family transcriptional regulator, transcriptional repressor of bet genes